MDAVLLVFAKVPRPGHVKTRLTPVLTPEEAARLYEAFLADALSLYGTLDVAVHLHLAPPLPDDRPSWLPDGFPVYPQAGEGLGERMHRAFANALADGYDRAAVVGTDHPTLPAAFVRQSFSALAAPRSVCIGPSADGGFYLLGMTDLYPQLFEGMSYSHEHVFSDTLARLGTTDAQLTVLPRWYDVDTPAALSRLVDDLADSAVPAPRTRAVVRDLALHELSLPD
jgi:rSAM/selenodomain-associated transferase 1